jgi:hypothetical protein
MVQGRSDTVGVVVGDIARWLRDEGAAGSNSATSTHVRGLADGCGAGTAGSC